LPTPERILLCYEMTLKCVTCKQVVQKELIDSYSMEFHLPCCAPMMLVKIESIWLKTDKAVEKELVLQQEII